MESVPAQSRKVGTRWPLNSLPTQTILCPTICLPMAVVEVESGNPDGILTGKKPFRTKLFSKAGLKIL